MFVFLVSARIISFGVDFQGNLSGSELRLFFFFNSLSLCCETVKECGSAARKLDRTRPQCSPRLGLFSG